MTRSTDGITVTLNGADIAEAIDQFVRRCHQDLDSVHGNRAYTLVTPAGPVAHFDVRCAVLAALAAELIIGAAIGGVTLAAGDRVLVSTDADSIAGIWTVATSGSAVRATDCDILSELVAKPYVRVTAGTDAGRWYLLDDAGILAITAATYTIVAQ